MTVRRILFGLDRLPRGLAPDDPRLPGITPGTQPLRLNTEPLPVDAPAPASENHAARVEAMEQWLFAQCGAYAPQQQRFVRAYLTAAAAQLQAHHAALNSALQRFHGLYAPEDWLWSALRPLPRAWLVTDAGVSRAEIAFWDGTQAITIGWVASSVVSEASVPGINAVRLTPGDTVGNCISLLARLPDRVREFWRDQTLPCSPFRRPKPGGILAEIDHIVTG